LERLERGREREREEELKERNFGEKDKESGFLGRPAAGCAM
jgi:hypothetical protein